MTRKYSSRTSRGDKPAKPSKGFPLVGTDVSSIVLHLNALWLQMTGRNKFRQADGARWTAEALASWDMLAAAGKQSAMPGDDGEKTAATTGAQRRQPDPLQSLLDETALKVVRVAESDKTLEEKLEAISALDCRFWGKQSPELASLLRVSPGRIRQTDWWKAKRPKHLQADAVAGDPADVDDV